MESSTTQLRITFGDDDLPEVLIAIPKMSDPDFYSLGTEQLLTLPNGEILDVYAEVSLASVVADVSLSIVEDGRLSAIRCGSGLVFSYTTRGGLELLFQIGTGPWDE
ncbi:hypothetical protein [Polaromonas aquatica]|uniref:hypothetical protein n=1 Tax=Polaromonas aquatica TaxID=332657 RepID=UPI003D65BEE8